MTPYSRRAEQGFNGQGIYQMGKGKKRSEGRKLDKFQKDEAKKQSEYLESSAADADFDDELRREAETERPSRIKVKVRRGGDIDFENEGGGKPVKRRAETVEEADLELGDEAFGFGLGVEERAEDEGEDDEPRRPRSQPRYEGGKPPFRLSSISAPPVNLKGSVVHAEVPPSVAQENRRKFARLQAPLDEHERARVEEEIRLLQKISRAQGLLQDERLREFGQPEREIADKPLGYRFPRLPRILSLGVLKRKAKEKTNMSLRGLLPRDLDAVINYFEGRGARVVVHPRIIDIIWNEDQPIQHKVGRPSIGDKPISNAEKQRRKRARAKAKREDTKC
jgi:hypothetical protein